MGAPRPGRQQKQQQTAPGLPAGAPGDLTRDRRRGHGLVGAAAAPGPHSALGLAGRRGRRAARRRRGRGGGGGGAGARPGTGFDSRPDSEQTAEPDGRPRLVHLAEAVVGAARGGRRGGLPHLPAARQPDGQHQHQPAPRRPGDPVTGRVHRARAQAEHRLQGVGQGLRVSQPGGRPIGGGGEQD